MKPFGESDFTSVNERRIESEFSVLQAEAKRRQRAYEGIGDAVVPLVSTPGEAGIIVADRLGSRAHSMDDTPPDIYLEGAEDLVGLKRELADLDRDIAAMIKHETVRYPEEEK